MRRRWATLCVAMCVLFAACGTEGQPTSQRTPLRIPILPFFGLASFHVAHAGGYFAEEGFDVEVVSTGNDAETFSLLASGQVDVAAFLVNAGILNFIARGGNIKVVADKGYADPEGCASTGLVAQADLVESGALDRRAGLDDRRISYTPQSFEGYVMDKVAEETSSDLEGVSVVDVDPPAYGPAFSRGALDVAYTSEPWITRLDDADEARAWKPVKDVIPGAQIGFLVYGSSFLENEDAGRRFMVAFLSAVREMRESKSERLVEILADETQLEPELVRRLCWQSERPDGTINLDSVLDFQGWAKASGYLDEIVPVEDFWDPRFVEYAAQRLDSGGS